ncbi:MAG: hypothetical protein ABW252_17835 [Polyangiales bacterium]
MHARSGSFFSRRAARVGVYLAVLTGVACVVASRQASAALSERSLAIGRRLDAFQELSGPLTEVSWNGEVLAVSTTLIEQPVDRVLARFVALCDGASGDVARALAERLGGGGGATHLLQRMLVMRDLHADGTGAAVCFAGLGDDGLAGLVERARRFTETLDTSSLGALRYTYLRKVNDQRTQVILVTAEQGLHLTRLAPRDGHDAPGDDIAGVRPLGAVRLLSAHAKGTQHGLSAYRAQHSPDAALADVGDKLRAQGFALRAAPTPALEPSGRPATESVRTAAYVRDALAFVVTSQPDPDTQGSLVSIVRLAADAITPPGAARSRAE